MTAPLTGTHSNAYIIYEFERRAYLISEIPVRIGRDATNDVVLRESAVSRFNTQIRRENDRCVIESSGSTPTLVDGVPLVEPIGLSEGARIEIGSAILTYTEKRLPIGVSVVERARREGVRDDVANRRDTIKHPLIKGPTTDSGRDPQLRMKIMMAVAAALVVLYLLGR